MANARRCAGFSCTVSTRALIIRAPIFLSFAQDGTRPQRSGRRLHSRGGIGLVARDALEDTLSVGATFQFGASASSARQSVTWKSWTRSSGLRVET